MKTRRLGKSMAFDGDSILVISTFGWGEDSELRLLILNKDLDSLDIIKLEVNSEAYRYADNGVLRYDNYYIVLGYYYTIEDEFTEFLIWIDRNTKAIDTIMHYPYEFLGGGSVFEGGFVDNDNHLIVYYDIYLGQIMTERGFLKFDSNKNILFQYKDTFNPYSPAIYEHAALLLGNGNMVYKQEYETPPGGNYTDFEVICIDPQGALVWRNHGTKKSCCGKKRINQLVETANGDIIASGDVDWHFDYDGIEMPIPDSLVYYRAPYILKLDGSTGEQIWEYSIIHWDEYDYVGTEYLAGIYELSDGSLFGGGTYVHRDIDGFNIMDTDSWFVKLPASGCNLEPEFCGFEIFLNSRVGNEEVIASEDHIIISPNPSLGTITLKGDQLNGNYIVELFTLSGNIIETNEIFITNNITINFADRLVGPHVLILRQLDGVIKFKDIVCFH